MLLRIFPLLVALPLVALAAGNEFYEAPAWTPRAILPAQDVLDPNFWPPEKPADGVDFDDPGFASGRLHAAPEPGVFPRVLLTPQDVATIQQKIALGPKAPLAFQKLWARIKDKQTPFVALVTNNEKLGRRLAQELVSKVRALGPKLDKLDTLPDRENLWAVERSIMASGDPSPPTEIWDLIDYDYLHKWMTPEERGEVEQVIARITHGRITNFMAYPDHFMINNHQGFGMEFFRLLLLIEGKPGFDKKVYEVGAHKAQAMLDWYLSPDGMSYESIKGWMNVSAFMALARRDPNFLKNSRWRSKMNFFQHAARWENGRWVNREEMRASAFPVIWMMRYFHPENRAYDWLYSTTFNRHAFLLDPSERWPNPVGVSEELLLLFAEDGMKDKAGRALDWSDPKAVASLNLPLTWKDDRRGYMITRNSWAPDDLQLGFTCKQDFFYGGHEGSETNRFVLWAGGVNWVRDSDMLAVKATFLQNMPTIDGRGLDWPPAPGVWLGVTESPDGVSAAGDGKISYSFAKVMQVHPLDFPSTKLPYYAPFASGNFDLTRDQQIAFHPLTVEWNDGYAHTDYGPWSGETRLVESYRVNNPVEKAYRTVYLARGEHPYVLVLDDLKKDAKSHLYEWNITLPENIDLIDAKTAEILFQSVPPGAGRESDLLLGLATTARDEKSGRAVPKKGDPLLLVRTLWRKTDYGFPVPRFEKLHVEPQAPYAGLGHLTIPAISDSPEFRVLLYPHRQGDPLPSTRWNDDRSELTVRIGDVTDVYRFAAGEGGRTMFSVERNGRPVLRSEATPPAPVLEVLGRRFDPANLRTTRNEGSIPVYPFSGHIEAKLERPRPPAWIAYTLDGSDPGESSLRYDKPIRIEKSCRLAARIIDPKWPAGPREGAIVRGDFQEVAPAQAVKPPGNVRPGLLGRVYEMKTVLWNNRGFFDASKVMLPDLDKEKPVVSAFCNGFALPFAAPTHPMEEQAKGFYRFSGWFRAASAGTYEFVINSCGPVLLTVGGREVVASKGVFHQQQAERSGSVVLGAGWHALDLIVCDPLFWNISTLDEMPFSVSVSRDGGPPASIAPDDLRGDPSEAINPAEPPVVWKPAQAAPEWLEPGVTRRSFDRSDRSREPSYLDIDREAPIDSENADEIRDNLVPSLVQAYEGWFHAPADGIYTFDTPARRLERDHLSNISGACQNQLRIDDEVVVQRGVPGRRSTGKLGLKEGWHRVSLRLGNSLPDADVTYPDGQTLPITAALLQRESVIEIAQEGQPAASSTKEIFGPTKVELRLPHDRSGTIHYTLDGSEPTAASPVYKAPFEIDRSTAITAAAVLPDGAVVARNRAEFSLVTFPSRKQLGNFVARDWDGTTGLSKTTAGTFWVNPSATIAKDGSLAVNRDSSAAASDLDVNVHRGSNRAGVTLSGMKMRDNAVTVGIWFRSEKGDGQLFGKDGRNAFGKAYRTVSASLRNGSVIAMPGQISGGKVAKGEWTHVVLTVDGRESRLYVNGEEVARGGGGPALATDSLDVLVNHPASLGEVRVFERVLAPEDVRAWFRQLTPDRPH